MKKTLITLAVLSSFAGGAFAQSNVSVYGVVDIGLKSVSSGGVRTTGIDSGGFQSGSRLGFKGTERLSDDLSASFVLETGINADTGGFGQNNTAFGRQSWVGLESKSMGALRLGNQYSPLRAAVEAVDPFEIGLAGSALRELGGGAYVERVKNSVSYTSPTWGGFSGQALYGFGETAGDFSANRTVGLGGTFARDAYQVRLAYHNVNSTAAGVDQDARDVFLGGTYDFGVVKAHAGFGDRKVDNNVAGTDVKSRSYMLGVSAPFGAHAVMASYIHNNVRSVADASSNQYAVGYTYSMSKRTNLYAAYAHNTNDSAVALNAAGAGLSANQLNLGIHHKF